MPEAYVSLFGKLSQMCNGCAPDPHFFKAKDKPEAAAVS
jgi:hypothetical protein